MLADEDGIEIMKAYAFEAYVFSLFAFSKNIKDNIVVSLLLHLYNLIVVFALVKEGHSCLHFFSVCTILCTPAAIVAQFAPEIFYIIPIPSMFSMKIYVKPTERMPFEFFIDKERYFVFYILYESITMPIGIFTTITIGTFMTAIGRHCCATYKIAR